ncbi:hypothetical protein CEXT_355591 [Caerostris extrusa]|uniref:Uncharacterized protein n=1 Tax=Caerostris extrusa TaxID=172846 RepID=A0AAV4QHS3_CAEEX|nr:hypothetical protein CEXT_355591 [Caerostris extrusa]
MHTQPIERTIINLSGQTSPEKELGGSNLNMRLRNYGGISPRGKGEGDDNKLVQFFLANFHGACARVDVNGARAKGDSPGSKVSSQDERITTSSTNPGERDLS